MTERLFSGVHFLLYSTDPDADRRFLHETLGFEGVDAGEGWLIMALPPAEIAVHPAGESLAVRHAGHDLLGAVVYLMCDDLDATVAGLARRGVETTEVARAEWGLRTTLRLPSGGEIGLYQPTHPSPLTDSGR